MPGGHLRPLEMRPGHPPGMPGWGEDDPGWGKDVFEVAGFRALELRQDLRFEISEIKIFPIFFRFFEKRQRKYWENLQYFFFEKTKIFFQK